MNKIPRFESDGKGNNTAFPHCRLHGTRLVFRLPEGCPYHDERPGRVLDEMQADAWAKPMEGDFFGGHMERYDICAACNLAPEVLHRLRRGAMKAAHRQQALREPVSAQQVR
jgi:hypothetical protein